MTPGSRTSRWKSRRSRALRLFVAFNLSDEDRQLVARYLAPLRERLASIKWVRTEQLHVTLKFLGDCPPTAVGAITDALRIACGKVPSGTAVIAGAGVFPNFQQPRVVWLGMHDSPLAELARGVDDAMATVSFPRETRPFNAHLTVARIDRPLTAGQRGTLHDWVRQVPTLTMVTVRGVALMQSELGPRGPVYTTAAEADLAS